MADEHAVGIEQDVRLKDPVGGVIIASDDDQVVVPRRLEKIGEIDA